jgi:hypothetical protein
MVLVREWLSINKITKHRAKTALKHIAYNFNSIYSLPVSGMRDKKKKYWFLVTKKHEGKRQMGR